MSSTFQIVNGDWVLNEAQGRPVLIADGDKLPQDTRRTLSIATQPDGSGAGLDELLEDDVDPFAFPLQVSEAIRTAIGNVMRLQTQRLEYRPDTERISTIRELRVTPTTGDDKTSYTFRLVLVPVQGSAVTVSGALVP